MFESVSTNLPQVPLADLLPLDLNSLAAPSISHLEQPLRSNSRRWSHSCELCIPSGRMRPSHLFCPTNEQSKWPGRLNDCKQNKYSLNMFSNFRTNTRRMHRAALSAWRRGSGKKKPSPGESGKDHRIVNMQLPHQDAVGQAAHSTHR